MIFELECQRPFFVALGRLSTESGLCKNNDFGQVIQTLHANSYKNITPEKKKKKGKSTCRLASSTFYATHSLSLAIYKNSQYCCNNW